MRYDQYSVKVTNGNEFDIKDYFDGVPYQIKANSHKEIPQDAFEHIFGAWFFSVDEAGNEVPNENMRDQIFLNLQRRWGWNLTPPTDEREFKRWISPKEKFLRLKFDLVGVDVHKKVVDIETLAKPRKQDMAPKSSEETA